MGRNIVIDRAFPHRGIVNVGAASEQPQDTTPEALNVRPKNSSDGRMTGGRRPGLIRHSVLQPNGTNAVRRMDTTMRQDPRVTYSGLSPTTTDVEIAKSMPLRTPVYAGATDRFGNLYIIDGLATVVKLSADGETVWTKALPTADARQQVRAIAVDGFGTVFAGVSNGGRDEAAKLWALQQGEEDGVEILWTRDVSAFVEQLTVYKQRLIALLNKPSSGEAWVAGFDAITSTLPVEAFRSKAPAPANCMHVGPKGKIAVVAEAVFPASRGYDPRLPAGRITEDWKLTDLVDIDTRVWAEYDPATLLEQGLTDGDPITAWPETYNGRDLYQKPSKGAPTYIKTSLGRLPAAQFSGTSVTPVQVLTTDPNGSMQSGFATQQRSAIPTYQHASRTAGYTDNAQTVIFILVRPERTLIGGKPMLFFHQPCDEGAAAGNTSHYIAFNCDSSANTLAGAVNAGFAKYWCGLRTGAGGVNILNGGGVGPTVQSAAWTETISNAVLLTIVLNHGTTGAAADHPSQFRINGTVVDEFDLRNGANSILGGSFLPTEIGSLDNLPAAFEGFRGTLHYMAVLNRYSSHTNSAPIRYPFTQNSGTATFTPDTTGDSELERVEGRIMHRFGCAHALAAGHAFADSRGTPNRNGIASHSLPWLLNQSQQVLATYSAAGDLVSVLTGYPAYRVSGAGATAQSVGGIGYGVTGDSEGNLYTMGPHARTTSGSPADDYTTLRKILDAGSSLTFIANVAGATASSPTPSSASGAWSKTYNDYSEQVGVANVDINGGWHFPRPACDAFDAVYFPWSATSGFTGVACIAYDKTGGLGHTNNRALTGNNGSSLSFSQRAYTILPSPLVPTYPKVAGVPTLTGTQQNAKARADQVWYLTNLGTGGTTLNPTVHRVRFITLSRAAGSPRSFKRVAVVAGVVKISSDGFVNHASPAGSGTLAQPELSSTAPFIDSTTLFGKTFLTDGVTDVYYDPELDVVLPWRAKAGRMLPRAKFLASWRASIVRARSADDGHTWQLSKVGDPFDWDVDPPVVNAAQSVSATASERAGYCPDIITGLVAVSDDLLVVFGDHTTWRLTGHPIEGGVFDALSTLVGAPFGRAHATNGAGGLFFLSNRKQVMALTIDGLRSISDNSIEYLLRSIDHANYHVSLVWNPEEQGLHVFQLPYGAGGPVAKAWFWHEPTESWWEDQFGFANAGVQPTAVTIIDGDAAGDRALLFGCEDGWIRRWDAAATRDDATNANQPVPIDSYVTFANLVGGNARRRQRLTMVQVELAAQLSGARLEVLASGLADMRGPAQASVDLGPGSNPMRHLRVAGDYVSIRLRSGEIGPGWALEHLRAWLAPAGRKRVR